MKIPHTDPIAAAALGLARTSLDARDSKLHFLFRIDPSDLVYDLHAKGCVAISSTEQPKGKFTLSMKAHFARNPLINVKAKDARILVGPKGYPMSEAAKKSESFTVLAAADPRKVR